MGHRDGSFVLEVKPSVSAVGVLPVKIPVEDRRTRLLVVPLFDGPGVLVPGEPYDTKHPFPNGASIDAGETVSPTQLFAITPEPGMVGVRVHFLVSVPRKIGRSTQPWSWATTTYVPVPAGDQRRSVLSRSSLG